MPATQANVVVPTTRQVVADSMQEEVAVWLFVFKTMLAVYITGWLAMRFALPQPSTAMLTTVIVANRQSGMVLAKSFYRAIGTLAGALAAFVIVGLFPQQRVLFLGAMALWVGLCSGGATLYRNFKSYAFVLAGYTAALIALPVINNPLNVFDSVVARLSEVLLGLLVSGIINDTVFPSRMREVLRQTARAQFTHFVEFIHRTMGGGIPREEMEHANLRFVRDAVTLEDLRSSVIFEDPEARARSGHMLLFNQRFMSASTSFQSLHHLINYLLRCSDLAPAHALIELYAPIGTALDATIDTGSAAHVLLTRMNVARQAMDELAPGLRSRLTKVAEQRHFDTGRTLLNRFFEELSAYIDSASSLQAPQLASDTIERVLFTRGNDFAGAALATVRATITMSALAIFWIASAWPLGISAMLIATVFAGLLASAPHPLQATKATLTGYIVGMSGAFLCVFFVLTHMDGYLLLIAGTAPFLMIGLLMIARPSLTATGVGYCIGFIYLLALKNPMVFDPINSMNDMVAQVFAFGAVATAFIIVPPIFGTRWLYRRQLQQLRRQVSVAAEAPLPGLRVRFESVNHDLFSQIVAQTAPGSDDSRSLLELALAVQETGRALIELRTEMLTQALPVDIHASITTAIAAFALFFEMPDTPRYVQAEKALAVAVSNVRERVVAGRLLDYLHLLHLSLIDKESVFAAFKPAEPMVRELHNAS
jgi:uncharacterized membrane protein YccC